MKGDAPMTSTKEIMMESELNETEQFFKYLKNHPCKYWKVSLIDKLFDKIVGKCNSDFHSENKQYKHYLQSILNIGKIKI